MGSPDRYRIGGHFLAPQWLRRLVLMLPLPLARPCWRAVYNALLLPLLLGGVRLAALRSPKVRETLAGRRGLWERLAADLAARDPARPLLWFHVASVGELLQAQPVLERCAAAGAQCVLTVTSVSGWRWARRRRAELPVLAADYLPADTPRNVRRLLALLRPAALVYSKYDLWPNLVWGAAHAGVPQYLLSATLPEGSWRARWALPRSLYRTLYAPLAGILAVTEADAARFLRTVPGHPGVSVAGSTAFDSVLHRRARIAPPPLPPYADGTAAPPAGPRAGGEPVLVVGSSWPADEQRILPVLREALARHPGLRIVLAPHEVHADHLAALERAFAGVPGAVVARYTALAPGAPPWRVLLVDVVGVLSALYAHAHLAYVGGAFTTGVHNVLEPAAMGAPPIFGPRHHNAPEAVSLCSQGLAFAVADADEFRAVLFALLDDPAHRADLGTRARAWVEAQAGAADRACARLRTDLAAVWPRAADEGGG